MLSDPYRESAPDCPECENRRVVPKFDGMGEFNAVPCPRCVNPKCVHCGKALMGIYNCCAACADERGP